MLFFIKKKINFVDVLFLYIFIVFKPLKASLSNPIPENTLPQYLQREFYWNDILETHKLPKRRKKVTTLPIS